MPIVFDQQHNTFKLDTLTSSYIIKIYKEGYLLNLYYGAPIPDSCIAGREIRWPSASFSLANPAIGENGFTPDTAPMEYGCNGAADFRTSALAVRNANGDSVTDIRYTGHRIYAGKVITGVIQFLTCGGFIIWQVIDMIRIVFGCFDDKEGKII